jgi:ribosomal protein S18 acetylase RimI-like enzyme
MVRYAHHDTGKSMPAIEVRPATPNDLTALQTIGRQTFLESFSAQNTAENMAQYLAEAFRPEKLRAELVDPNSQFYFATLGPEIVGYLKINFAQAQTELRDEKALEIERIYVLKDFQGQRIGQLLFEKALEVARSAGADYVWLGVWEKNHKALAFYQKNGFVEFDRHPFRLGDDLQTDIMMKKAIG